MENTGKMFKQNLDELAQKLLKELNEGHSASYLDYLKFASQFHSYSFGNIMLIKSQMPHATRVASFNRWKELGRSVKKGEKSLKVLAPLLAKKKDGSGNEEMVCYGFKAVAVFDYSQTDGDPIPQAPLYANSDEHLDLYLKLKLQVEKKGILLEEVDREVGWFGSYGSGVIKINQNLSNHDKALTIIHEMAHWLLKHDSDLKHLTKAEKECQAESAAFIVAEAVGMKAEVSRDYLLSYGNDAKVFLRNLDTIFKVSQEILDMLSDAEQTDLASSTTNPAVA